MSSPTPAALGEIVLVGFPDVELLDLTGPFEVLSTAAHLVTSDNPPRVRMAAPGREPFASRNGLELRAACTLDDVEAVDLLVIPGGRGVRPLLEDAAFLALLDGLIERSARVLSVCTGALLLAKLGRLDGRAATTHHLSLDTLRELAPTARVASGVRWVEDGPYVLSAGVSAGTDAALHVVAGIWGAELATRVAEHIEHVWTAHA